MFVCFYTCFIEEAGYGAERYFRRHSQLSFSVIEALVKKETAIIGIDSAGIRRGKEHPLTDQYCADHGVFVVENLCNLDSVL